MISDEQRAMSLTRRELAVIFLTCKDKSIDEIAAFIHRSPKTVQHYRTKAYFKLGLTNYSVDEKQILLKRHFCPLILRRFKTFSDIQNHIPINPYTGAYIVVIEKGETEDEIDPVTKEIIIWEEEAKKSLPPPSPPPPPPRDRNRTGRIFLTASFITASCIGLALLAFIGNNLLRSPAPTLFPTAQAVILNTPTIQPTPNILKTQEAGTVAAQLILRSEKPTFPPGPTNTPLPPTDTPIPLKLPFTDNFTNGYDKRWTMFAGDPAVSNGRLIDNSDTPLLMSIGNGGWSDYVVDVSEVAISNDVMANNPWEFYIGVRVQDLNNFIAMKYPNVGYWYIVDNGVWNQIPNSEFFPGPSTYNHNFTLTVKGNEFTAKADGGKSSYFILPDKYTSKFKNGGVLLNVDHILGIDLVRINAAP